VYIKSAEGWDTIMAKLLYITVNPKKAIERSKGRQLGEVFLEAFKEEQTDVHIENWDLYTMDFPRIDEDLLYARAKISFMGYKLEDLSEGERSQFTKMHELCDKFMEFDYFVFVTPIWNLGAPAILKDFLDNLFITNKTMAHTPEGAVGLLKGKKAIHIQTRGGIYSTGRMKELESGDRHLTQALDFLGMDVMETVYAEGMDHFPKQAAEIMAAAKLKAAEAAREMAKLPVSK
jgi:FMN-dependent NADH-azoreductase